MVVGLAESASFPTRGTDEGAVAASEAITLVPEPITLRPGDMRLLSPEIPPPPRAVAVTGNLVARTASAFTATSPTQDPHEAPTARTPSLRVQRELAVALALEGEHAADDARASTLLDERDDVSIPPIQFSVRPERDTTAELFFRAGDDDGLETTLDVDKAARRRAPHVIARRAKLTRWVRGATGGAAIVCILALLRTVVAGPAAAPAANVAAAAEAPLAEAPPAAKEAPPPAVVKSPAETPPAPGHAEEKHASLDALQHGQVAASIEAGERAVSLDKEDGEAWLILGAAYQERGDYKNAQRCYRSCLAEGRRGPREECRQMVH